MITFPPPALVALGLVDAAFIALVIIILGCLGWLAFRAFRGVSELESMDQEAEKGFEEHLLQELKIAGEAKSPALDKPADALEVAPEPSLAPPPRPMSGESSLPPPPPSKSARQDPVLVSPSSIATRLQGLNIVKSREGKVPLPIPPDGEIFDLVRGGSCLILPRQESEALMYHFTRRFDLVIFPGPDGDLVVVERFQNRLPSLLDLDQN